MTPAGQRLWQAACSVALLAAALVVGMGGLLACCGYHDSVTPSGIPNLARVAPRVWRSGQLPPDPAAWADYQARMVAAGDLVPGGRGVYLVALDDVAEGSGNDAVAARDLGWVTSAHPIPPEDDKPWSVAIMPDHTEVAVIVDDLVVHYEAGWVVAWHCVHGRDRTSLVGALVGMRLWGWSRAQAWADMQAHGYRWVLPDLDAYWLEYVIQRARRRPHVHGPPDVRPGLQRLGAVGTGR